MSAVLAWLATYAVHSTLLLGAVAVVTHFFVRRDAWRDTLWKVALVGGIATASLQVMLDLRPVSGTWQVAAVEAPEPAGDATETSPEPATVPVNPGLSPGVGETEAGLTDPGRQPGASGTPLPQLSTVLVFSWALVAFALLARLGARHFRLLRILGDRRTPDDARALEQLAELRRHSGVWRPVRLTVTDRCSTPLALGTSEICVPAKLLALPTEELRSALAHELAHLARHDPLWQLGAGVIEALFFFQPLNRLARLRLRAAAEHLSDDWAVRHTGSAVSLARCLAAVASWIAPTDPVPQTTIAMAEGGSPLLRRVERLLDTRFPGRVPGRVVRLSAAATLVALVLGAAPAVTAREHDGFQGKVEIVQLTNEQGTLLERFAMAQREARRRGLRDYWIAYAFEGTVGPFRTDSDSSARDRVGGPTLGDVMYQGKWDKRRTRGDIVPLFRMRQADDGPARLVRVAGRSYERPAMPDQLTIYCLDTVTEDESLTLLDSLIPQFGEGAIRDALLAINATHGSRRRGGIGARRFDGGWSSTSDPDPNPDPDFDYDDDPAAERVALTPADYSLARANARRYDKGVDGIAVRRLASQLDHVPLHGADLIRERATWALARMKGDALVAPLLAALNAADWHDRAAAAWSLAAIADARAAAPLRRALADHAWRVRAHALYGLGVLRDRASVPVMIELLGDQHWQVRAGAAENLGLVGDSTAVPALKRALGDSHFAVTDAVETALAKLH